MKSSLAFAKHAEIVSGVTNVKSSGFFSAMEATQIAGAPFGAETFIPCTEPCEKTGENASKIKSGIKKIFFIKSA